MMKIENLPGIRQYSAYLNRRRESLNEEWMRAPAEVLSRDLLRSDLKISIFGAGALDVVIGALKIGEKLVDQVAGTNPELSFPIIMSSVMVAVLVGMDGIVGILGNTAINEKSWLLESARNRGMQVIRPESFRWPFATKINALN